MQSPLSSVNTRRRWLLFALVHGAVLLVIAAAFLWRGLIDRIPPREPYGVRLSGCALHDVVHIYCPLCGGTRAMVALCRGQLWLSLQYNPLSAYLALGFAVLDAIAAVRIARRSPAPLVRIPRWYLITGIVLAALVFIVRNGLMIFCGLDNLDGLAAYW